jgi:hypothetical protein
MTIEPVKPNNRTLEAAAGSVVAAILLLVGAFVAGLMAYLTVEAFSLGWGLL